VAVNISSPNTKNLRALQGEKELGALLAGLAEERTRLEDAQQRRVPVAVKIAPDLADDEIRRAADALVRHGLDAIIATNTTLSRAAVQGLAHADEAGGLSGKPLAARSTEVVALLSRHLKGRLPIIGVGGVMSGADAVAKMEAGASLVQIYTGFIYGGPDLVGECVEAIAAWRKRQRPRRRTA
jgi:dihydroorotate dehydrogenase